ncbi:hypothetical protein D3C85_1302260 [compost metagenome]
MLLRRAARDELRGEELAEGRVLLPPAQFRQPRHQLGFLAHLGTQVALEAPPGVATVQHEVAHPLGMRHGVRHGDRRALGNAQQREMIDAGGVHDGFEITQPRLEGQVIHVAVREATATFVVAHERVVLRQRAQHVAPDRTPHVEFEVAHPVGGLHERRSAARDGIRQSHPVTAGAKAYLLLQHRHGGIARGTGYGRCGAPGR